MEKTSKKGDKITELVGTTTATTTEDVRGELKRKDGDGGDVDGDGDGVRDDGD